MDYLSLGFRGDTSPNECIIWDRYLSWITCSMLYIFYNWRRCYYLFLLFSKRFLLLIDNVSESDVSLNVIFRFSLRKMGVSCLGVIDCVANGPAWIGCVGGAASVIGGLKWRICVKSGLLTKALSCFGLHLGMRFLSARATLLEVDIHDRPDEMTLTLPAVVCFAWSFCYPSFLGLDLFKDLRFSARVFSREFS